MIKVGITGGIGSGKTLVCSLISNLGYPVYHADLEAKILTNNNPEIIFGIKQLFGEEIYINGELDRKKVAQFVFTKPTLLGRLSAIIHPVVAIHFDEWSQKNSNHPFVFKEAAILFESDAYKQLDQIIAVSAPTELRIQRVMKRDGVEESVVRQRIAAQMSDEELTSRSNFVIQNDGKKLLTPQVIWVIELLLILSGKER